MTTTFYLAIFIPGSFWSNITYPNDSQNKCGFYCNPDQYYIQDTRVYPTSTYTYPPSGTNATYTILDNNGLYYFGSSYSSLSITNTQNSDQWSSKYLKTTQTLNGNYQGASVYTPGRYQYGYAPTFDLSVENIIITYVRDNTIINLGTLSFTVKDIAVNVDGSNTSGYAYIELSGGAATITSDTGFFKGATLSLTTAQEGNIDPITTSNTNECSLAYPTSLSGYSINYVQGNPNFTITPSTGTETIVQNFPLYFTLTIPNGNL